MEKQDTIFAQSSALGRAGVSIFRISGPYSLSVLKNICTSRSNFQPRQIYCGTLRHPKTKEIIDHATMIFFQGESSFTGEDTVELYTHGSIAISKLLLTCLSEFPNLRMAEAGEFTKRAFLNNKIDLTSAEGIADLIDSETSMQHKQAIKQVTGELAELYGNWRKRLIQIFGFLQAYIDFPDEEIPNSVISEAKLLVSELKDKIHDHLNDQRKGERIRNGISMVIIGPTNVGKSSLTNYLTMREVSIVSDSPGTTRDVIQTHLDIQGYPITLNDTAGIRFDTQDVVEKEGINRAIKAANSADIRIFMSDIFKGFDFINKFKTLEKKENNIFVVNKTDLGKPVNKKNLETIPISLHKVTGLDNLLNAITVQAEKIANPGDSPVITRVRHRIALEKALFILQEIDFQQDLVLLTEDIRIVANQLSIITGKIYADDVLEEIFSNFCIGK